MFCWIQCYSGLMILSSSHSAYKTNRLVRFSSRFIVVINSFLKVPVDVLKL